MIESINKLKNLDLSTYPVESIKNILTELNKLRVISITLSKGKDIIRARPNKGEEIFKTISDISYKPPQFNTTFQRASTPNNTMFYGCVIPHYTKKGELDNARVTAIMEASNLQRKSIDKGEEKITFSRWKVIKDIKLVAIVYHNDFIKNSTYTNELNSTYQKMLREFPEDVDSNIIVTEYLAGEFAKKDITFDYDYLISALFTERVTQNGLAGVYYPSVRTEGEGFNVAIHPYYVDNCMKPFVVGECTIYKKNKHVVLDNDSIAPLEFDQKEFSFDPIIDPKEHSGREECYKVLNGEIKIKPAE